MALTESEKTELKNDILNAIKAESQGVNELTEVTSLDNIKSLHESGQDHSPSCDPVL